MPEVVSPCGKKFGVSWAKRVEFRHSGDVPSVIQILCPWKNHSKLKSKNVWQDCTLHVSCGYQMLKSANFKKRVYSG